MKRLPILPLLVLSTAALWAQATEQPPAQAQPQAPAAAQAPTASQPPAPAQAPAATDWFWGKTITAVQWQGVVHADKRELDSVTRNYIGKPFTDDLWLELQSRLYELDWFDKIDPTAVPSDAAKTGVIIKFVVVEKPSVDAVRVSGNSGLRTNELLDTITVKSGEIYNPSKARVDELAVRRLYLERGYPDATVSSSTSPGPTPSTIILTFKVVEGTQVSIREIRFSGNAAISSQTLKGQMSLKESALFQSGAFQESKLEDDKKTILDYYHSRGYVDAAVADVVRNYEKDPKSGKNWLILTLVVKEGRQWTFGSVSFEGNNIFGTDKLGALVYQKPGSILNYRKLLQDKQRVDDLYYESGYIFNSIDLVEKRDEDKGSISFTIRITERGRAHIESIVFKGNKKTKDYVLSRELPLEVGDIFSKEKIVEGLRNLTNLQYFSAVEPEMFPGSAEDLMKLQVTVEEQSTADIQFGITLSGFGDPNAFPVSGLIKLNDRNWLGNGQNLGVALNVAPDQQALTFSFSDNWLFGKRLSGGVDLSFAHKQLKTGQDTNIGGLYQNYVPDPFNTSDNPWNGSLASIPTAYLMPYDSWDISLGFSAGYAFHTPVGDLGVGGGPSFGVNMTTYDASKYRPYLEEMRDNNGNWRLGNKLIARTYLNDLDNWYNPGKGFYASQRFTWAGILPLEYQQYLKSESKVEAYLTLFNIPVFQGFNFKWILGAHSGFTALLPKPGQSLLVQDDWLYIDGTFTARGWHDLYGMEGLTLWDNWVELRMPLFEQFLWLDGFFDAAALRTSLGMVNMALSTPIDEASRPDFSHLAWVDMAMSVGFGFRFVIPQFPFRFYLAKRFTYDGSRITWQTSPGSFDFVISITQPLF